MLASVSIGDCDGGYWAILCSLQNQFFSIVVRVGWSCLPFIVQLKGFGSDGYAHCVADTNVVVNGHRNLSCHGVTPRKQKIEAGKESDIPGLRLKELCLKYGLIARMREF